MDNTLPYRQIPYAISDYYIIRRDNLYFVDKTKYITDIERAERFLFMSRPRRFGKSLFLSMLENYYDINKRDQFDMLFGNLYIGQHPTPLRNHYLVLHLDFSQVTGNIDKLEERFDEYCSLMCYKFLDDYHQYFNEKVQQDCRAATTFSSKLTVIINAAKTNNHPLYLFLDEYDNFMNTVLHVKGKEMFKAITHGDGFYRDVFKLFKGNFERIFMIGVSPMTLDDLTSGFNIATNLTMNPNFNQAMGFSETDVREMIRYYQQIGRLPQGTEQEEIMIAEMKPWYNNYCFAGESLETDPKMYNSDMVLYYMKECVIYGRKPQTMLDSNTRTDYKKLQNLVELDQVDGLGNYRESVIMRIIDEGKIYGTLVPQFSVEKITNQELFLSLLYYYGMLTITGTDSMDLELSIPNNNIRKQYYEYLVEYCSAIKIFDTCNLKQSYKAMARHGEYEPALRQIAEIYANVSSVRNAIEGERNIQGFYMAFMSLNPCYLLCPEMEFAHGYCDFFLMPDLDRIRDTRHSYVVELKYHAKGTYTANADEKREEATAQLERYASEPRLQAMLRGTQLHKIILQFEGWKLMEITEV